MDGHPDQMVMPEKRLIIPLKLTNGRAYRGTTRTRTKTGKQVFMGLAGLFIIESAEEKALNLPSEAYELPLVIQDKRLNASGELITALPWMR